MRTLQSSEWASTGLLVAVPALTLAHASWRAWPDLELLPVSLALAIMLVLASRIDIREFRLPDVFTLPLIAAGPLAAYLAAAAPLWWSVLSAALGFALIAGLDALYRTIRGTTGIGLGDAKLLAAAAGWTGLEAVPGILLIASGSALAVVMLSAAATGTVSAQQRVPFGPFLSLGFWLSWLYGPLIVA